MSFITHSRTELSYHTVSTLKSLSFYVTLSTLLLKYLEHNLKLHIRDSRGRDTDKILPRNLISFLKNKDHKSPLGWRLSSRYAALSSNQGSLHIPPLS